MSGIMGYIGKGEAYPILIEGMRRLAYRGYDSAGMAILDEAGRMNVYKLRGSIDSLVGVADGKPHGGHMGIAHIRWATHGAPSNANAHPHVSSSGNLALVHNGLIDNYLVLRNQLQYRGVEFASQTDSEVLVQFIDYTMRRERMTLAQAVSHALRKCCGAYALAVIDRNEPQRMVVAANGSPLVVGVGKDGEEFFVTSDPTIVNKFTSNVVYVGDGQVGIVEAGRDVRLYDIDTTPLPAEVRKIDIDIDMLSKEGFPHFMLKEIFDQPYFLRNCMSGRLLDVGNAVKLNCMMTFRSRLLRAKRFLVVGCGSSWIAGLIGRMLIEKYCRIPVEVEYASEFRYRDPIVAPDDVLIAVSQSGESADTLAAARLAKQKGACIFGIVNSVGSSIARLTDTGIYTHVGPQMGVAATKNFTAQVACFAMLALALGRELGAIAPDDYSELVAELKNIPAKIEQILAQDDKIKQLAIKYAGTRNFIYLGQGWNLPIAFEGALKLKEVSGIHAEGYPAAEMKHGAIALIDRNMPCLFLATGMQRGRSQADDGSRRILSNMEEARARHGHIIALVTQGDAETSQYADEVVEVPPTCAPLEPLLNVVPLQLFAYHLAVMKSMEVDVTSLIVGHGSPC